VISKLWLRHNKALKNENYYHQIFDNSELFRSFVASCILHDVCLGVNISKRAVVELPFLHFCTEYSYFCVKIQIRTVILKSFYLFVLFCIGGDKLKEIPLAGVRISEQINTFISH